MMRRLLAFLALVWFAVGCADTPDRPDYEHRPGQVEAIDTVWYGIFAKNIDPPLIDWVSGDRLTCQGQSFMASNGTCALGEFLRTEYRIRLAVPGSGKISDSSFVHELCHAKAWAETSDSDPDHVGTCAVDGPARVIGQAALVAEGL